MAATLMKRDRFCWCCCDEGTTVMCSHCIRSFHNKCIENDQGNIDVGKRGWCPVCLELDSAKNTDTKEQLEMLPIMINRVVNDKEFDPLKDPLKFVTDRSKCDSLVNLINLMQIKHKINTYTSFCEFLVDIEWILNNCLVLFPENHMMVETAKLLKVCLELEVESVKKCVDCYSNANKNIQNWFTMVCGPTPHLVLWDKMEGWNYWPAKLISIDGQMLNIRYFGDYSQAKVQASKCFFYSESSPMKSPKPSAAYQLALNEANIYTDNLRIKFGSYHLFKTKTRFDSTLLSRYFADFIPVSANARLSPIDLEDNSFDSITDVENDQGQNDAYLSTFQKGRGLDEDSSDDLTESDLLTDQPNGHSETDNNEQNRKKARLSNENNGELANMSGVRFKVKRSNDSITEDPEGEESNAPTAGSSAERSNIDKCQKIMMDSTNRALEEMKKLAARNEILESRNRQLTDQLKALKLEHNKMIGKKNEERMDAVNEAKKQFKEEYELLLEEAKKQTFCAACDSAMPDAFNFCNSGCQRDYWTKKN